MLCAHGSLVELIGVLAGLLLIRLNKRVRRHLILLLLVPIPSRLVLEKLLRILSDQLVTGAVEGKVNRFCHFGF